VTLDLHAHGLEAVVLDIEGTTTPLAFVQKALFPFARRALEPFVRERLGAVETADVFRSLRADWLEDVKRGESPPSWPEDGDREQQLASIVAYAEWQMDSDRKAFGLKALQGLIWERGYRDGLLRGDVFPDVPAAFARWRAAGITIAIFSSGSVLAQQLLFRSTPSGDLTPHIAAFFDTSVGAKGEPESYRRIAAALNMPIERVLFISDAPVELAAARAAGYTALLCARPGNQPATDPQTIHDFTEVV
jgi:enolase-phosphatase E1